MIKTKVIAIGGGKQTSEIELPAVFETPYRPEVIHKVYVNLRSHSYQRQGRYPAAGEMVSAESRNTGLGIARLARARGEGFPRAGQAAGVAGVRHGRVAHPPESWKNTYKKINEKEKRLGLCSAIAATARKDLIEKRGHRLGKDISVLPIIVSNDIESITKTKDLKNVLVDLGLGEDIARANNRKARSGTARRRGRQARTGKSALVVVGNDSKAIKLSQSVPGIDIRPAKELSVLDLAPGSKPIRLTIYTQNAIEQLRGVQAPIHKIVELIKSK